MKIKELLIEMGDRQRNKLIDPAIVKIAKADSAGRLATEDLIDLIITLNGKVPLLRDKEKRTLLTNSLKPGDVKELCVHLGLSEHNPWDQLAGKTIRKNSSMEKALFEWFQISEFEIPVVEEYELPETLVDVDASHGLFEHQRSAVRRIREMLNSDHPRAFLHMPTGSGKTRTAMNYICETLSQSEPCLVVWFAFNGELCEQAAGEFQKAWSHHGNREVSLQRMWGEHDVDVVTDDGVLFVGLDKLWAKVRSDNAWLYNLAPKVELLVFDEAHQSTAETYQHMVEIVLDGDSTKLLGLSATPGRTYNDRTADSELSDMYYRQKVTLSVKGFDSPLDYLVKENYLSKPVFHQMSSPGATLSERDYARVEASEDYSKEIVERLSDDEMRNLLILDRVKALVSQGHHRIIVFANNVRHSNILQAYMSLRTELRCASITADTPSEQRKHWLDMFRDTEDKEPCVLFNYGVLTTGFDAPLTSAAVISRPTKSLVLYSQMVGRVIRGTRVGGTPEAEIWTVVDQNLPGFRDLSEAFNNWNDVWDD
jgi:superfamily II DNA or RNA helicase